MNNPTNADTPTPAASAGPDFEAADECARDIAPLDVLAPQAGFDAFTNLARAYLALRSLPREGEASVAAWYIRWEDGKESRVRKGAPDPNSIPGVEFHGGEVVLLYASAAPPLPAGRPEGLSEEAFCDAYRAFYRTKLGNAELLEGESRLLEFVRSIGPALPAGRGSEVSEEMRDGFKVGYQVGERHWVCGCGIPDNLADKSHTMCAGCGYVRPTALGRGSEGAV